MNLGRNQLMAWINHVMCCQYTSIQMLADGIAFAQLIDAIHPGSINIFKINLATRYPDDCLRNLKIVEDALKKLKIGQPFSFDKMSRGRFQDNITFLQWIYSYSNKCGLQNLQTYEPFQRRIEIIERQGKSIRQINPHLIPNQNYIQYDEENENEYNEELNQQENQQEIRAQQIVERIEYMKNYVGQEENHLKGKMELNWRLMQYIDRSIQDRNTLYLLLKQIETLAKEVPVSSIQKQILSILHETPQDFN